MATAPARQTAPALAAAATEVIFRASGFGLGRHRCASAAAHEHPYEEVVPRPEIVFVRSGSFVHRCGRGRATVDANQALFLNAWEGYRVSHPASADDCFVVRLPPAEVAQALGAAPDDRDAGQPFTTLTTIVPLAAALELHRVARRAAAAGTEPVEIQERLLAVVAAAAPAAAARRRGPARASTRRDHRERAEAVKLTLARRLGEGIDLATLAREVHASPFHLARLFRAVVGTSIHRYLLDLRLRHAASRLAEGERDLAGLAFDLGFADHAHLTRSFRRALGTTPSAFRHAMGRDG